MKILDILIPAREALLQAQAETWGGVFYTDNVELFKARVYKVMKELRAADPEDPLLSLSIRTSPSDPQTQVWIVKKNLKEVVEGKDGRLLPNSASKAEEEGDPASPDNLQG